MIVRCNLFHTGCYISSFIENYLKKLHVPYSRNFSQIFEIPVRRKFWCFLFSQINCSNSHELVPLHVSSICEQKFLWTLIFANYSSFAKIAKICVSQKISHYIVFILLFYTSPIFLISSTSSFSSFRYDNEYGYSCRVVDLVLYMASRE